jgi:RNA polymerase sigma-70 factor (ECF subfamily)
VSLVSKLNTVPTSHVKGDPLDFKDDRKTVYEQDPKLEPALNGDREALGELLASYTPKLRRAALRILGSPHEAEEALQDGFVQVVKHVREFAGRSMFSSWVTRIVINAALMRLRNVRRQPVTSIEEAPTRSGLTLAESIVDPRPNPEEIYAREERIQILKQTIKGLPEVYRSVLWLRDVRELSTREAAKSLGIPAGSVKARRYRGRSKLSREFCDANPPPLSECAGVQSQDGHHGLTRELRLA